MPYTRSAFPKAAIEQGLMDRFYEQVDLYPERIALQTPRTSWTYADLNAKANSVATALVTRCGGPSIPIGILLNQGSANVAAILGILKAGKFYVPFEPSYPASHATHMLRAASIKWLITDRENHAIAARLMGDVSAVLLIEDLIHEQASSLDHVRVDPHEPAYIFFTSGSTGTPKGVVDSHRNVLHNVYRYTNALSVSSKDKLTMVQSGAFSGTVSSLFTALLNGATLLPFDLRAEGFLELAKWIQHSKATIFHSVPSIFRAVASVGYHFPDLRVVRLEGDRSGPLDVERFRAVCSPRCCLANGLGATETGLSCQFILRSDTTFNGVILPLGKPTPDMEVALVNGNGESVAHGDEGEIEIRSEFLATGYWGDTELTNARFLTDPSDRSKRRYRTGDMGIFDENGLLHFRGRKDLEHKVNGHRVDIVEVERHLMATGAFRQVLVLTRQDDEQAPRLVAYVVRKIGVEQELEQLRHTLYDKLPEFSIPSALITLSEFPVGAHGKIDRSALPKPDIHHRKPSLAETTKEELSMITLWEAILETEPIGPEDNFFDLGGDSLKAALLSAELERRSGRRVPPTTLFKAPTLSEFVRFVEGSTQRPQPPSPMLALQTSGTLVPIFMIDWPTGNGWHYADVIELLGEDQPFYCLTSGGHLDPWPSQLSMEDLARNVVDLIRKVQPVGPIRLAGNCYGGTVAFEVARQLDELGTPVAQLSLFAVSPIDLPTLFPKATVQKCIRAMALAKRRKRFKELRQIGFSAQLRYVREKIDRSTKGAEVDPVPDSFTVSRTTLSEYRPIKRMGLVQVVISEQESKAYTDRIEETWSNIASDIEIHLLPDTSDNAFFAPAVHTVARILNGFSEKE